MKQLLSTIKSINSIDGATNLLQSTTTNSKLLEKAIRYTQQKHINQYRKSGEEYVVHPILVACICAYFKASEDVLIAALLHDVVEDTPTPISEIEQEFSPDIANIVAGLTKISKIDQSSVNINSAMSFEKMIVASSDDVRVLVIKLCDRLHNLLSLDALREDKQKRIANESIKVYASIAHKLGMHRLKNHLEDLSFKYIFKEEFNTIDTYMNKNYQELELKLNSFVQKVETMFLKNGFIQGSFNIEKRVKHYYSIFRKMQRKSIDIDEVLDLYAIRIIVKDANKCYLALGVLHQNFKPLFDRFKDYISLPKENGYQTIHTTLFDGNGITEVQIRTQDMNKTAKYGVAAHWRYKNIALSPDLSWIHRMNDNFVDDSVEKYYELCKNELYIDEVQVFTPSGDIVILPRGSCGLDFAYAIHSDIGNNTEQIFIDGKRVPLLTLLQSGDIISVKTSKTCIIRCTWVDQVKTSKAKKEIIKVCKERHYKTNLIIAYKIIETFLSIDKEKIDQIIKKENIEYKFSKISIDFLELKSCIKRIKKYLPILKRVTTTTSLKIFDNIEIVTNKKIKNLCISQCCNPTKSDEITAIYTKNQIDIHNKLCPTFNDILHNSEIIFVKWVNRIDHKYKIIVSLEDKIGSLADFLNFLKKYKINLTRLNHNSEAEDIHNYFEVTVEVENGIKNKFIKDIKNKFKIIDFSSLTDAFNKQ